MVSNANVQNRVKHYDILLSRELVLIERKHEQALLTQKKLEQTIRHESKKIPICSRKKNSIRLDEIYHDESRPNTTQKRRMFSQDKGNSSDSLLNNKPNPLNEKTSKFIPKYRRLCTKAHRLPPVTKSHIPSLHERMNNNNNMHWMASYQPLDKENGDVDEIISLLKDELSKRTGHDGSQVDQQVHSFMENLPPYEGAQKGFDNFAPSALYSTRATVAMR